jgi:hypothetical protein
MQLASVAHLPGVTPEEIVTSGLNIVGFSLRFGNDVLDRTHGHFYFDNTRMVYSGSFDDVALNAGVARFSSTPDAEQYLAKYETPTGRLQIPVLTLHTTRDPVVPFFHEGAYAAVVEAAGASALLYQRSVERYGHCAFTAHEMAQAFTGLRAWVETGVRPGRGRAASLERRQDASANQFVDLSAYPGESWMGGHLVDPVLIALTGAATGTSFPLTSGRLTKATSRCAWRSVRSRAWPWSITADRRPPAAPDAASRRTSGRVSIWWARARHEQGAQIHRAGGAVRINRADRGRAAQARSWPGDPCRRPRGAAVRRDQSRHPDTLQSELATKRRYRHRPRERKDGDRGFRTVFG